LREKRRIEEEEEEPFGEKWKGS